MSDSITKKKYPSQERTGAQKSYYSMKTRCTNPNSARYKNYGGRGIKICDRWMAGFKYFLEDMGERPEGMTLDRIDIDGDYTPENCRWATDYQQSNNKQDSHFLEFNGESLNITQWEQKLGFNKGTISNRINCLGWSVEKSLTTPAVKGRNQYGSDGNGEVVEFNGRSLTWNQWAVEVGIDYYTLKKRQEMGWPIEKILGQKLRANKRNHRNQ